MKDVERYTKAVTARQFDKNELDDRCYASVHGVYRQECYCGALAQDGQHCPNHGETMRYELRDYSRGHKPVKHGDWIVDDPEFGRSVVSKDRFEKHYRPDGTDKLASDLALAMQVVEAAKVVKDEFEETQPGAEYDGSHKKAIDALITALAALKENS